MKLLSVHSILWSGLLVLWASQSETNHADVCRDQPKTIDDFYVQSSVQGHDVEGGALHDNYLCVLYPTNLLNCSWSLHTLQKDIQLSVHISICDDESTVYFQNHSSEERVGSRSLILHEHDNLYVILHFNITLHDKWTVYSYTYDMDMLEVMSPPQNISASVQDGGLLVRWDLPQSRNKFNPLCFEYQLDIGDQENLKTLSNQQCYTELNADPHHTYRVRIRTRKMYNLCGGCPQWSDWSHAVTVERSFYKLSTLVIVSISLGIPMILLAVLLLVRHQRVSKVLFPPIPRPPAKYKYFLEKNDTFNLFHPALSAEPVEEITEVEDTEQNPGKTF